jgi:hypothetical protein
MKQRFSLLKKNGTTLQDERIDKSGNGTLKQDESKSGKKKLSLIKRKDPSNNKYTSKTTLIDTPNDNPTQKNIDFHKRVIAWAYRRNPVDPKDFKVEIPKKYRNQNLSIRFQCSDASLQDLSTRSSPNTLIGHTPTSLTQHRSTSTSSNQFPMYPYYQQPYYYIDPNTAPYSLNQDTAPFQMEQPVFPYNTNAQPFSYMPLNGGSGPNLGFSLSDGYSTGGSAGGFPPSGSFGYPQPPTNGYFNASGNAIYIDPSEELKPVGPSIVLPSSFIKYPRK